MESHISQQQERRYMYASAVFRICIYIYGVDFAENALSFGVIC